MDANEPDHRHLRFAVALFLQECPEWADGFQDDGDPRFSIEAAIAFVNWAQHKGLCQARNADRVRRELWAGSPQAGGVS